MNKKFEILFYFFGIALLLFTNEYTLKYQYFDECFGINLDFTRHEYFNTSIQPTDKLTLTFSFKNLGAYKSTNLAVSELDKQDIRWDSVDASNENFN